MTTTEPSIIGSHVDYVRCLAHWCVYWTLLALPLLIRPQSRPELDSVWLVRPDYQALGPQSIFVDLTPSTRPNIART